MTGRNNDHAMTDAELLAMAQCVVQYLSREDALFVARVAVREAARFAALMSVHGGTRWTGEELARLQLRIAKQIHVGCAS